MTGIRSGVLQNVGMKLSENHCRLSAAIAFLEVDGNYANHKHERNTAMNKLIITLAVAALALGAFAQENDSTAEH